MANVTPTHMAHTILIDANVWVQKIQNVNANVSVVHLSGNIVLCMNHSNLPQFFCCLYVKPRFDGFIVAC